MSALAELLARPCPVCGRQPEIDECHPPGNGFYAMCYALAPHAETEHCVGGSGETRDEAIADYNRAALLKAEIARSRREALR